MRKVWEVCKILGIMSVFPVGMFLYMYFTVPKFKKNDCIMFDYGPKKVYTITDKRGFRYILNGKSSVSIEFTDRNAFKVKCR